MVELIVQEQRIEAQLLLFDGELLEVQVPEHIEIVVGDFVSCYYLGNYTETRVIRRTRDTLYLFAPLASVEQLHDRRIYPRIDVNLSALVIDESLIQAVKIVDLSVSGIAFTAPADCLLDAYSYHLAIHSEILSIVPQIIIHETTPVMDNLIRYGAKIIHIKTEDYNKLRTYIMFCMLWTNYHNK